VSGLPDRPILVFDGDCGFCTASADFARRWVRPRARIAPWQRLDLAALGLTEADCTAAVQWVDAKGDIRSGAGAVAATLRAGRPPWPVLGRLIDAPVLRPLASRVYALVAANRGRLPGSTPACATG
jgi:predicted DCC family thiol-disulfide oxidoreductase YuxK